MIGLVDRKLSQVFGKLGHKIALYPKYFIISSVIVSLTFGTGIIRLQYEDDFQHLYTNYKGNTVFERSVVEKYFPANYSGAFSPSRISRIGRIARFIIVTQDGGSVFREKIWKEVIELDALTHSAQITADDGRNYNYSQLCGRPSATTCYENEYLDLGEIIPKIENGSIRLSYPVMVNPETFNTYPMPIYFSGFKLSSDNLSIISAEAMALAYFVKFETSEDNIRGNMWEKSVSESLQGPNSKNWKYIKVYHLSYYSLQTEQENNNFQLLPYVSVTVFFMCSFALLTTMSRDMTKSKPWVAMSGLVGSMLGCLAAIGFLSYIGVPVIGINLAIGFIMLGIGLDDTFVILSAWRQTNVLDSVPNRLSQTYAEAAVSITITSLTDMLSFYVGLMTPIPAVQIFCTYAGTCVFWIYIYQLFFVGAILAIAGHLEAENGHGVLWWKTTTPKSLSDGKSTLEKLFFIGGIDKANPRNEIDHEENMMMGFFRDHYSKFIIKKWVRGLVIILFIIYVGVSGIGLAQLEEGMKEENLYSDNSHIRKYFLMESQYFKRYLFRVQVVIKSPLNYSEPKMQERVGEILTALRNSSRFVAPDYSENWLQSFTNYVTRYKEYDDDYDISTEENFIRILRQDFLPDSIFETDVVFSDDGTQILASRYIIQLLNTYTSEDNLVAIVKLREVAAALEDVEVIIFNPWSAFVDQFILIRPMTIQLLSIAAAIVMVVAIIFIPNFVTSVCVLFTIASTELGVLGFMSLWGVRLDIVSIICLIMCIGFSVDFSAHVSYAYISSTGSAEERISKALYSLGLPILQGGISTIIGVLALVFVPSYIPSVFFKVTTLVIFCSSWHGLFVLPVLLLVITPETLVCKRGKFKIDQSVTLNPSHNPSLHFPETELPGSKDIS